MRSRGRAKYTLTKYTDHAYPLHSNRYSNFFLHKNQGISKSQYAYYQNWLRQPKNKDLFVPLIHLKKNAKDYKIPSHVRKNNVLPSGYTRNATWNGLKECWMGFKISKNHRDMKSQQWYAAGIQRFCYELGMLVPTFPELKMAALSFFKDNADWLPADISGQEVFEIMLKNDFEYLKKQKEQHGVSERE